MNHEYDFMVAKSRAEELHREARKRRMVFGFRSGKWNSVLRTSRVGGDRER